VIGQLRDRGQPDSTHVLGLAAGRSGGLEQLSAHVGRVVLTRGEPLLNERIAFGAWREREPAQHCHQDSSSRPGCREVIRKPVFRPQADQEVQAARRWYEEQQPELGAQFANTIDEVVERIASTL
jgi:hypothetical protein